MVLSELIGVPAPPALVADTLTATSLSLEWDGPRFANISYLVQWRYEEIADTWQYCRNLSWGPHSTVLVENLQPYTKYRVTPSLLQYYFLLPTCTIILSNSFQTTISEGGNISHYSNIIPLLVSKLAEEDRTCYILI